MDQENDKNPIAEIFDEMFTLLEAMETRSVAMLDYLQGQQGVTDENLAPYMDRAASASEVRWRAARARMEHLLAPKPKSSTAAANDAKGKDEKPKAASQTRPQAKDQSKPDSKDLGKELASAQPAAEKSPEEKDSKTQNAKPAAENQTPQNQQNDPQKGKGTGAKPKDPEPQASALAGDNKSETQKSEAAKTQSPKADASESPKTQSSNEEKRTQKAAN